MKNEHFQEKLTIKGKVEHLNKITFEWEKWKKKWTEIKKTLMK